MINKTKIIGAIIIVAFASTIYAANPELLIKNGTIITVTKGTIDKGDILLKDGKIAEIGSNLQAPPGASEIDATGKFIMPGIIDPHSHIGVYAWPDVSANDDGNEMTDPITPQVRAEDSFNTRDPGIKRAIAGGVTTIQSLPGSANIIGGQTLVVKLKPGKTVEGMKITDAPPGMKMALGENPKMVYGERGQMPSTRMGNIAIMREWLLKGKEYGEKWARFDIAKKKNAETTPPERNLKLEALWKIVHGDFLVHVHCYEKDEMLKMMKVADEFGFKIKSFEHATESYMIADSIAARNIFPEVWVDWWGFKVEAWDAIPQAAGILASKGVRVTFHSDSADEIQRLWLMAAKAVRNGMDRQKAYEAITINPAAALGLENKIGSIEVGKDADIAIFSGQPFNIYSRVDMTIIDGEIVFDRSKEPSPMEASNEK